MLLSEDFAVITSFVLEASKAVCSSHAKAEIGVVQFSNDTRVEVELQKPSADTFKQLVQDMVRTTVLQLVSSSTLQQQMSPALEKILSHWHGFPLVCDDRPAKHLLPFSNHAESTQ